MGSSGETRVLVVERVRKGKWRAVEADVGADGIDVVKILLVDETSGTGLDGFDSKDEVVLVSNSTTSVCRLLDIAEASQVETERMVALRLETELPYPVEESTWACRRQNGSLGNGTEVLVIATETETLDRTLDELRYTGRRCTRVELDGTAFADLVVACAPGDPDNASIAVVGNTDVTLVVTHGGVLRYVRRFSLPAVNGDISSVRMAQLANELDQSLYDYALRTKGNRPDRLFLGGSGSAQNDLVRRLGQQLNMPVETVQLPSTVNVDSVDFTSFDLVRSCPACIGVLLSLHRRIRKGGGAGPPLITGSKTAAPLVIRKRGLMVTINTVLLAILVALSFAVRTAQINASQRIIDEGKSMLRDIEVLEEEVGILKFESARHRSLLDVIVPLTKVLPKGVKIESCGFDSKGTVNISGTAKSVEDISDNTISAMEDSSVFLRPKFHGATKEKTGYSFRLTCELRKGIGGRP